MNLKPLALAGAILAFTLSSVCAQSLSVLHTFSTPVPDNFDGSSPRAGLVVSGLTLYGTVADGGTNASGGVFSVNTDGTDFTVLHDFTPLGSSSGVTTNADGAYPAGTLAFDGLTLYGTTSGGGTNGSGTVFSVNPDGTGFTVLHTFSTNVGTALYPTNFDGADPKGALALSSNVLYGTTVTGGTNGIGTLFSIHTDGTAFTVLHTFVTPKNYAGENSDGAQPETGLTFANGTLYGTASSGGSAGYGTVFSVNTNGANFTVLHSFTLDPNGTNTDGVYPAGGLVVSGATVYGTARDGGTNAQGTVFALNTTTKVLKVLHTFPATPNTDGANPEATLALAGDTLYGTANVGGTNNDGTVFSLKTNGTGFYVIYPFSKLVGARNSDGGRPGNPLVVSGDSIYSTTQFGGANAYGTVFGLAVIPGLVGINTVASNVVLTATNGVAGAMCQVLTSTNIALPPNQWLPISTNVLTNSSAFTVTATNALIPSAAQQFFMLEMQ